MKTYTKFLILNFVNSLLFVTLVLFGLVIILNVLTELEFFKNMNVKFYYPIYLALINAPSYIFDMFPFIILLATQVFFFKIFENNQIQIFKYSGLKNLKIIQIISLTTLLIGVLLIFFFYNISASLKSYYLESKLKYSGDGKYLAVITNNGLWIKDVVNKSVNIVNASKINDEFLIDAFITKFDQNYEVDKNIISKKINIKNNDWVIDKPMLLDGNNKSEMNSLLFYSNFNYEKIKSLFSNLSSLSLLKLIRLKKNYDSLNYSSIEVSVQIQKLISYPIFLTLMTILSSIIMYNSKALKNNTVKLVIGLFFSALIYYINNFFYVLGNTEKISILISVWLPLLILALINISLLWRINEK